MKYLWLIYTDETPPDDIDAVMKAYWAFTEELVAAGKMVSGEALEPSSTATTVRVRDDRTLTTDGPFAETTEVLGGYYLTSPDGPYAIQAAIAARHAVATDHAGTDWAGTD